MEFLMENMKWIFSGIVDLFISILINIFVKISKKSNSQKQNVKNNSTGIQVGRDFKINEKKSERKKR